MTTRLCAVAFIAVMACACGSSSEEKSAAAETSGKKSAATARSAAGEAAMTSAVAPGKGSGGVDMKFELVSRPDVGQPVELRLAVIPLDGDLERIQGSVQASEGLELLGGREIPLTEKPQAGTSIAHTVTLRPTRDGIFYVSAVVLVDSPRDSIARSYSIPIIAGAGMPAMAGTEDIAATNTQTPTALAAGNSGTP